MRKLNFCPNCLSEHPKGQCNIKYRCQIDDCNGFHHSTIHRKNFNTTQPSNQGQKQSTSECRQNGDNLNRNQFNFTNNSSSWNKNLSSTNPIYNHQTRQMVTVLTTGNAAEADTTASTATATIAQMVSTTIVTLTTDITGTAITNNHIKCPKHPLCSNGSQLWETLTNNISTQQTKIRKVSQAAIADTRTTLAVMISRAVGSAHMFSSQLYW